MVTQTIALIERVQQLVGAHREFFDAIKQWYSDVKLARKVIKLMIPR